MRASAVVSIHAPTRGATRPPMRRFAVWKRFDPRPHARGDLLRELRLSDLGSRFDPRPHARGDSCDRIDKAEVEAVSIHAPTRGATPSAGTAIHLEIVSIHAPTRGATTIIGEQSLDETVSIHAPTRGATPAATDRSST